MKKNDKIAVFTIAQDEPSYAPLWVSYYRRFFASEDVYVLDHNSVAPICLDCQVVRLTHSVSWHHEWLKDTVQKFQEFLFQTYDVVLFSECDEFIAADPVTGQSLTDIILSTAVVSACNGFNIIHDIESEGDIDVTKDILSQRRFMIKDKKYNKCLVSRVPLKWKQGFHALEKNGVHRKVVYGTGLLLLHLHYADFRMAQERAGLRSLRVFHDQRGGQHNRFDVPRLRDLFLELKSEKLQEIPLSWKSLIPGLR